MLPAAKLKKLFPGLKPHFPIGTVTTFGVGGRVSGYLTVTTPEELIEAVETATKNRLPYTVMAGGSNVVFGDKLLKKIVFHYHTPAAACLVGPNSISCNAGIPLGRMIEAATAAGLQGLETLSGIPGTVGGAIVGNAGAYGQCISDHLESIEVFVPPTKTRSGQVKAITKTQGKFAYRDSIFKHKPWLVLRAHFVLVPGDRAALEARAAEIIRLREKKYAPGLRCPGSFFKNLLVKKVSKKTLKLIDQSKIIEGKIPAGYLLQAVDGLNLRVGDAYVASFHGNLIVNGGQAKFREVKKLAEVLRRRVKRRFGLTLEEEVRYIV